MNNKSILYSLILALLFLVAFKGNTYAYACGEIKAQQNETLKSDFLSDTKGTVEALPEVCNGGSLQYNIFKLKDHFGNNSSFSVKQNAGQAIVEYLDILSFKIAKIPGYLFYRRIRI
jgi:hypothetical protein